MGGIVLYYVSVSDNSHLHMLLPHHIIILFHNNKYAIMLMDHNTLTCY